MAPPRTTGRGGHTGWFGAWCARCGYFFCSKHKYTDQHACTFDYKRQGQQQLSAANPTIAFAKVDKI